MGEKRMNLLERLHSMGVHERRVRVLAHELVQLLPQGARLLDVGCGDGTLAVTIQKLRPDVTVEGVDVLVRPTTAIPVTRYDGRTLPFADDSFDAVMMVDVLHHADDAKLVLAEARRVARQVVLVKDHRRDGFLADETLRFMDWVGNARHGVSLPYNYWSERQWREAFAQLGLTVEVWRTSLGIYPWPASWLFDRSLHFVARLQCG
jgi:ubiquinone/menaquinone biosynthesis C-methylase UbiE